MTCPRDGVLALCEEYIRAEKKCFPRWCALIDGRGKPAPGALVASQAELHEAAEALRRWCLANTEEAEAQRQELMIRQVEGELAAAADVRARRDGESRERIRSGWVTTRWSTLCERDSLACGLGWPHRGEPVTVSTRDGERSAEVRRDGIYLGDVDVFEVSHQVWLHQLAPRPREGTVTVRWSPCGGEGPLGPADPGGDIGLRLLAAPRRRLPAPLMRWPGPADVGIAIPGPAPGPTPALALFDITEIPSLAAAAARPAGSSVRRARRVQTFRAAEEGTLF